MSDPSQENQDPNEPQTEGIKQLRERAEQQAAELAAAKRELALTKAGVDLESPLGKIFAKAYDGELDPEVIKAEWATLNPAPPEERPPSDEAQNRDSLARGGSVPPPQGDPDDPATDPIRAGQEAFDARLKAGSTREDASAEIITRLIDGAVRGDKRVVFDREEWKASFGQ